MPTVFRFPVAVLVTALVAPSIASAQRLTRADVVQLALSANPEVLRSRENLGLLDGRITEERAAALPEITLRATATRYRDPALLNSSSFDAFPEELRNSLKPIGANLFEGLADVRQTLYSFKLGRAIRAARLARDIGEQDARRAKQAVALEAIRAYNALLYALEQARITEGTFSQRGKQLEMVRNRRSAGVATELDVLRSEVALENARAQMVSTRGAVELARTQLNAVTMRPIDAPVDPADTLVVRPFDQALESVIAEAMSRRPELQSAALNERIRDELVGIAQAEKKPTFDFSAAWGYSVREPGNFLKTDFTKWSAGVIVAFPLFDGFRNDGKIAQARAERNKASQDRLEIENLIRVEARDAFERLRSATQVLTAADLNVEQARRVLEMTEANYRLGASALIDVIDAQTSLLVAEATRVEALHQHANARATVRYVMGLDPLD
jgi:outer membrane protein TolC